MSRFASAAFEAPPFSDNLDGESAVLSQYKRSWVDGHFVVFYIPASRTRIVTPVLGHAR